MNLQEAFSYISAKLQNAGILNFNFESREILKDILNISNLDFLCRDQSIILSNIQKIKLEKIAQKRVEGSPLAYILGSQFFLNNEFYINSSVLIPRVDSEILVRAFMDFFTNKNISLHILDIGTGSGCLILSLLLLYQNSTASALDISKEALDVCKINSEKLKLTKRCTLIQSDIFAKINDKFDVIISNPPYIDKNDPAIALDVLQYEPKIALFAEQEGLFFYDKIFSQSKDYLNEKAVIIVEVGYKQAQNVINMALSYGFNHLRSYQDNNFYDRVLLFQ